jgi:hypothetical protein
MASQNPETEQAIKDHGADVVALRNLVSAGCKERMLINVLSMLRDYSQPSWNSWEGLLGQAWPGFRDDLKKKAKASIQQIRECAAEFKRLESTKLWELMVYERSSHSPGSQVVLCSHLLEYYADAWSQVIDNTGPKKHPFSAEPKAILVAYVWVTTGVWHDEELSALIEAVTGKSCDAHALLQWRSENEELIHLQVMEFRQESSQKNHPQSA